MVEHSTADREVPGSNPGGPFNVLSLLFYEGPSSAASHMCHQPSIGGSVVEFSPATREARVRFPADAFSIFVGICILIHFFVIAPTFAEDSVAQLVERLTPDQKVACSSHVGVSCFVTNQCKHFLLVFVCTRIYCRFHGVVVITSALHAEGREFEPRWNLFYFE